nr:MAG TPA: hypothetical protein [Bacteriophage sp.]
MTHCLLAACLCLPFRFVSLRRAEKTTQLDFQLVSFDLSERHFVPFG